MRTSAPPLSPVLPLDKSWLAVYADLFKARLTALVLLTTAVGFYLGWRGPIDLGLLFHTILGTALVASGGGALNQLIERRHDGKMRRTQDRPLPSGRLQPQTVLRVGALAAASGLLYLGLAVNWTACLVGACTFVIYVAVYTPLKRVTWLNTIVGAVPGALPPVIGWVAARGELGAGGWALFAIQAFWQLPHFMSIAWIYRDEYAKAGFKMLLVLDPEGRRTARHSLANAVGLLLASLVPFGLGLAGPVYLVSALILGAGFLWAAGQFCRQLSIGRARQLFYASLVYLPLLLVMMVLDKVR